MSETDLAYYERRASQERAAAERASDVAAERHRTLAESYEAVVNAYRKLARPLS